MAQSSRRRPARGARRPKGLTRNLESLEPRQMLAGGPVISEFLARNEGPIADRDGEFSDWIEVTNTSAAPLNLAGWYLADNDNDLAQWTFPVRVVPAGGTTLVFASVKDRATAGAELHTN